MPHSRATRSAAMRWSPVHIQTCVFAICNSATQAGACGARASLSAMPANGTPLMDTATTVDPSSFAFSTHSARATCSVLASLRTEPAEATRTSLPRTMHRTPTPVVFSKTAGLVSGARTAAPAASVNARARGCSLESSAEPVAHQSARSASRRRRSRSRAASVPGSTTLVLSNPAASCSQAVDAAGSPPAAPELPAFAWRKESSNLFHTGDGATSGQVMATRATLGLPLVSVPVLSSTTCVTLDPSSNGTAPLRTRMPCFAAVPVAAITAVGVARPRAQGQATRRTVSPCSKTKKNFSSSGHMVWRSRRMASRETVLKR
mmetsp:Transcript_122637/g.381776  ORF Transcript_122637/g.381776 Transcript_122637/m.381776 type:complete len:319 (+) Transcript_122637:671-1627(+)